MKCSKENRSSSRLIMGVPLRFNPRQLIRFLVVLENQTVYVRHHLRAPCNAFTALAFEVVRFLITCASSSTILHQVMSKNPSLLDFLAPFLPFPLESASSLSSLFAFHLLYSEAKVP